jgi:hypothetical protein
MHGNSNDTHTAETMVKWISSELELLLRFSTTKTKASRGLISWLPHKFSSLKNLCIFFQNYFPFMYILNFLHFSYCLHFRPSSSACCVTTVVSFMTHPPAPTLRVLLTEPVFWQKSPAWTRQTDGKNLVWFGEIERKLAKLSMTTFTYRSSP